MFTGPHYSSDLPDYVTTIPGSVQLHQLLSCPIQSTVYASLARREPRAGRPAGLAHSNFVDIISIKYLVSMQDIRQICSFPLRSAAHTLGHKGLRSH